MDLPAGAAVDDPRVCLWGVEGSRRVSGAGLEPGGSPLIVLHDVRPPDGQDQHLVVTDREQERAARFRDATRAAEHVAARGIVRAVAAEWSGLLPAEVPIAERSGHKPRLTGGSAAGLDFNISHADGRVACAFLVGGSVGVDIEGDERPIDAEALAPRILSRRELNAYADLPLLGRPSALLRCWVRKEAVLKAAGLGLSIEPSSVEAGGVGGHDRPVIVTLDGQAWRCWSSSWDDLVLAVAWAPS